MKDHTKVCSWCGKVMHRGTSGEITHGICKPCYQEQMSSLIAKPAPKKEEAA